MTQITEAACLKADALELERGERLLFTGLTFEAPAGTLVRLAGANGTGKTSLLRLLTGLMQPDAGEILYKGQPIRTLKEDYYKDLVYIGHLNGVKDDLSAIENVRIAARMGNIIAKNEELIDALEKVGLGEFIEHTTGELSQGVCLLASANPSGFWTNRLRRLTLPAWLILPPQWPNTSWPGAS